MGWLSRLARPTPGWLWTDESGARLGAAFAIVVSVLASIWLAEVVKRSFEAEASIAPTASDPVARGKWVNLEALQRRLLRGVVGGERTLGAALIELHHAELRQAGKQTFDLEQTLTRYATMLAWARSQVEQRRTLEQTVVRALERAGLVAYSSVGSRLSDAFLSGSANCEGVSHLVASLLYDLGFEQQTYLRHFANHLAPELVLSKNVTHFGLTRSCRGSGVRLRPLELLTRFRPAKQAGSLGRFEYPQVSRVCDKMWPKASRRPRGLVPSRCRSPCAWRHKGWPVPACIPSLPVSS